jgi:hypothetical protein
LERFRSRQQETADDSVGRRVPAPFPAPSTPTRLRPHSQLRLPCQPTTCSAVTALLSLASGSREHPSYIRRHFARPSSLTLEVSRVRRHRACRRAALNNSTSAPFSARRPLRSMKTKIQPHVFLVSAHAYCPCVSHRSNHLANPLAAGSQPRETILQAVPCRQDRSAHFSKPDPRTTRIAPATSKTHSAGTR